LFQHHLRGLITAISSFFFLCISGALIADIQCPGPALTPPQTGTCSVTAGTTRTLLRGNVITPEDLLNKGEVLIEADGTISCSACDCSASPGYASATKVECANGVIAPGLIDSARHVSFDQNTPIPASAERYEHRHDWRTGRNGHTQLSISGSASADQKRWGELRALMAGTTSMISSGSQSGLVRNLTNPSAQEGLNQTIVRFQSFPLGDTNGTSLDSTCAYPGIISSVPDTVLSMLVSEGIDQGARNEFHCLSNEQDGGSNLLPDALVMPVMCVHKPRRTRVSARYF